MTKTGILFMVLIMAGSLTLYAANVDKGKALFESPKLGGGTTGKSCKTCHNGGEGLDKDLLATNQFTIMGKTKNSLAEVINVCIENPLGGKAIDPEGEEMQDLIAYIKTLVAKPAAQ
jgi:cytochrome c2